jgi:hypothetical protein
MDECNKDCSKEYIYLFVTSIFTSMLWLISEIIGTSSCNSNGVFEFIVNGFCVEVKYETVEAEIEREILEAGDGVDERSFLISKSLPHHMGI